MGTQYCRPSSVVFLLSLAAVTSFSFDVFAEDTWGVVKGRIVFAEAAPAPEKIAVERDPEVCGIVGQFDESLIVHKDHRGISNVAVWLETRDKIPVHPDLEDPPPKLPSIDNRDCRFEPRLLTVRTGQPFELKNSDPVAHNAAVYARRNTPFSEIIPMHQPLQKKFAKAETLPVRVDCSIHSWMKAWMIVSDHPYVAITSAEGTFELRNVPAGTWKFRFWHERPGYLQALITNGRPAPLEKGNWMLDIHPDETLDLGDLIAPAEQFTAKKK